MFDRRFQYRFSFLVRDTEFLTLPPDLFYNFSHRGSYYYILHIDAWTCNPALSTDRVFGIPSMA